MNESVKGAGMLKLSAAAEKMGVAVRHILLAVLGYFMAGTVLWGGMMPLGAALLSGVPLKYIFSVAGGSGLGYILSGNGVNSFGYTAALLAIVTTKLLLSGIKGIGKNALWSGLVAAIIVSSIGVVSSVGFLEKGLPKVAEGVLAGAGAYFIHRAFTIRLNSQGTTVEQTASLMISVSLGLTALFPIQFDGISLGRIIAFGLILFTARYGRVGVASCSGVAAACAVLISAGKAEAAIVFAVAGLVSGVFSGISKVIIAISPVFVAAMWVLVSSAGEESLQMLAETAIAGAVFLVVPKSVSAGFGTLIAPPVVTPDTKGLRRTVTMRLGFASAALHGVSETVDDVSRCLAITQKPSFAAVLHNIENGACKGCSFHIYCWEKKRDVTENAVLAMCDAVRQCRSVSLAEVADEFSERCLRIERFEDEVAKNYSAFLSNVSAEKRVTEMREAVCEQMNGIADMLSELADEMNTAQNYDVTLAGRVSAALKELNLRADECSCVVDRYGRLTVEVRLFGEPELPLNRAKILSRIEEVCERDFEPPEINRVGRVYYITAAEKAVFSVDCAYTQFNQGKCQHCGDTCRYFFDGRGRLVVIVSDGMGSGGRAAVDSAMTAGLSERLIKAGFGYDCTLRMVNSAMLYKSTDESMATLDIACIDLYSGKTELYKAGAAPTVVRRNGRTGKAECRSLPAGILQEVGFDKAVITLDENDIILMLSDGVCFDGTDWICAEVESFAGAGAKQLSERIATAARRRRRDGHDDDITVFAAVIEKAV